MPAEQTIGNLWLRFKNLFRKKQAFDNDCKQKIFVYEPVAVRDEAVRFVDQFVGMLRSWLSANQLHEIKYLIILKINFPR